MTDDAAAYEAWGKAVIEEVLFRTGLALSNAKGGGSAEARLEFRVVAGADRSLTVEFERVAASPERLRISLDT